MTPIEEPTLAPDPGLHDFDFLMGRWSVKSRRLKQRLAECAEWIEKDEGPPVASHR
jgi:hypothetical protein